MTGKQQETIDHMVEAKCWVGYDVITEEPLVVQFWSDDQRSVHYQVNEDGYIFMVPSRYQEELFEELHYVNGSFYLELIAKTIEFHFIETNEKR